MNQYFEHITAVTPGILSSLFIWKEWLSKDKEFKEARTHIDNAVESLMSLNEILIESESNKLIQEKEK